MLRMRFEGKKNGTMCVWAIGDAYAVVQCFESGQACRCVPKEQAMEPYLSHALPTSVNLFLL